MDFCDKGTCIIGSAHFHVRNRRTGDSHAGATRAKKPTPLQHPRLFTGLGTPSAVRIRFVLKYFKVPFDNCDCFYGRKIDRTWPYKKMPVLKIGHRVVNDGFVIMKTLAPLLQDNRQPMTAVEEKLERMI